MMPIEAPPPYTPRDTPAYEPQAPMQVTARTPLVRPRRNNIHYHPLEAFEGTDTYQKIEFGIIAGLWCAGCSACFYFACRS